MRGASHVAASQVALGATGLLTLPLLSRRFGPATYGEFSLFVTLLGVVVYQDFARQLAVHEQAKERAGPREIGALCRLSTLAIVALAAAVGAAVLEPSAALALVAAAVFHGLASRDWAALCASGRAGSAWAVRNVAWAGAFLAVAAASFASSGPLAWAWPFALANLAIFAACRSLAGGPRLTPALPHEAGDREGSAWARWSGWSAVRRSPSWPFYRREALHLLAFTLASSVLVSADRLILERTWGGEEFGLFAGHCDLAIKLNLAGSALGAVLFPMLARAVHEEGFEAAARRFVRIASWTMTAAFAGLFALALLERELVALLLGPAFMGGPRFFPLLLVGIFVQQLGFLITPWQRACSDFATQGRAYVLAAALMIALGAVLIPLYGGMGALVACLAARAAELQLLAREARALPRSILPRWRLAAGAGMLAILALVALQRFLEGPAGAM